MNFNRDRDRAAKAKNLLDNELFNEAFDTAESAIMRLWQDPTTKPETRESLWHQLQGLNNVKGLLTHLIMKGKMAEKAIQKELKK